MTAHCQPGFGFRESLAKHAGCRVWVLACFMVCLFEGDTARVNMYVGKTC